jgi:lipid-binding SYLF domain-containing protein
MVKCWQNLCVCTCGCDILFYADRLNIKKLSMKNLIQITATMLITISSLVLPAYLFAQDSKDNKLIEDSKNAKAEFIKTDGLMQSLFDNSYGYVILPNVGKGGMGIGGAAGNGIVFEHGKIIGRASMKQVNVGFQFGGQAYREVIFFENAGALDRFKQNKLEFSAQASAVAVTAGASANVKYANGVMVFTQEKGGLMYEATIGGQKFSYTPF